LNIAARSLSLLLHVWCVFCRKSKLARLPRAPHPDDAVLPPDGFDASNDVFMATAGRMLRLHMLGTSSLIFVAVVARADFVTMYGL
jgi:hypothetical protein